MKVSILRGLVGSGKSTLANKINDNHPFVFIVSADYYQVDEHGYCFNPALKGYAHNKCFKRFIDLVSLSTINEIDVSAHVIVDNTNISVWELSPYYRVAEVFGCDVRILNVNCDPETAFNRNIHGVPRDVFSKMYQKMLDETPRIPPWWKQESVD